MVLILKRTNLTQTALLLGALAILGSCALGYSIYRLSKQTLIENICTMNLNLAHTLGAHVEVSKGQATEAEILNQLQTFWEQTKKSHPTSYLCVVPADGKLALQTKQPKRVGTYIGTNVIPPKVQGTPKTVGELVRAKQDWVGMNRDFQGARQLVAYAYVPRLDSLIAVHVPAATVEAEIRGVMLPWALGFIGIIGVMFPLAWALLYRAATSAQKETQTMVQAVRESEEKFRQVAENINEVFWLRGKNEILYISPAYEALWGRSCESLYQAPESFIDAIHPDDREIMLNTMAPDFEEWGAFDVEYRIIRPGGGVRWIRARRFPIRDEQGRTYRYVGIAQDITAQKRRDHLAQLVENVSNAIISTDLNFDIKSWNRAAEAMYGWRVNEIREKPLDRVLQTEFPSDSWEDARKQLLETGNWSGEVLQRRKDGTPINILTSVTLLRNREGNPIGAVAVNRDINQRKQAEIERQQHQTRLMLLNSISTRITAGMSVDEIIKLTLRQISEHFQDLRISYSTIDDMGRMDVHHSVESEGMSSIEGLSTDLTVAPKYLSPMQRGETVVVLDVTQDERTQPLANALLSGAARAFVDVPLRLSERLVGLLCFDAPEPRQWSEHEIVTLTEIAEYLSVALKEAYEQRAREQAEQELRYKTALLEAQSEASIDGILVVSTERKWVSFNRRFIEMWGIPDPIIENRLSSAALQCVTAQLTNPEEFRARIQHLYQNRDETSRDEISLKDGRFFDRYSTPINSQDGTYYGRVCYYRDITEQKRAAESLRRFSEQLQMLHEVSNTLSKAETFDDLCRQAVELGRNRLGFDRLGIWFVDKDPQFVVGSFGVDENGELRDERGIRLPADMEDKFMTERRWEFQTDTQLFNDRGEVIGRGTHASAVIWDGEAVIGYISADNLLNQKPITERDCELLALYATTLGHLCLRVRAEQRREENQQRLQILHQLEQSILAAESMEAIAKAAIENLSRLVPCSRASVMTFDFEADRATVLALRVAGETWLPPGSFLSLEAFGDIDLLQAGKVWRLDDFRRLEPPAPARRQIVQLLETAGIRSGFKIPLIAQDNLIGALNMGFDRPGAFSDAQIAICREVANSLAVALRQAQLHAAMGHEIEERWRSEVALRKNQELLEKAEQIAYSGSFDWDIPNNRLIWSDGLFRIFKLEPEAFEGTVEAFLDHVHPDDRDSMREKLEAIIQAGKPFEMEERIIRTDGAIRHLFTRGEVATDANGASVRMLGICQDITERKVMEAAYQKSQAQLIQADKLASIGELVGNIAHEVNNPIGVILSRIELMRLDTENQPLPESFLRDLDVIETRARGVANTTRGLLTFARHAPEGFIPTNINAVLNETLALVENQLTKAGIAVERNFAGCLPLIEGNTNQLGQVFLNLFNNARDAMPDGGTLRIQTVADTPQNLSIVIEDTGTGIASEHINRLFEPFFTTKAPEHGTGLGLSIGYGIIQAHGGTIEVESEIGNGAKFIVTLPES
jgi:PAS domain S-box-containing protein